MADQWGNEDVTPWESTYFGSQAGSQTGGSGAGLPGFDSLQAPSHADVAAALGQYGEFRVSGKTPAERYAELMRRVGAAPPTSQPGDPTTSKLVTDAPPGDYYLPGENVTDQPPPTDTGGGGGGAPGPRTTGPQDYVNNYQSMLQGISRAPTAAQKSVLSDKLARELQSNLTEAGHQVKWVSDQELEVDGRSYTIGSWNPSGRSGYQPGEIPMDDLPTFTFDSLMRDTASPQMDQFMSSLLANPESMNQQVTDTLKAKSKDEIAAMDVQNQEQLQTLGRSYGIQESPWLAAQQLDAARARDQALIGKNRDIDIEAARTNMGDRRAAAALGQSWNAQKQSRVFQAASADIARAAATGDRLALRESVQQKAAELNISAEQVLANHIQFKLGEATKRYGIDVDAALKKYGVDVSSDTSLTMNADNLAQADKHHLEELAMQLQVLEMNDAQFRASHDLEIAKHQEDARHNLAIEGAF